MNKARPYGLADIVDIDANGGTLNTNAYSFSIYGSYYPTRAFYIDAIVRAGGDERWSDIPTEALLAVPDAAALLRDAWPTLLKDRAQGVARMIRILNGRHRRNLHEHE